VRGLEPGDIRSVAFDITPADAAKADERFHLVRRALDVAMHLNDAMDHRIRRDCQ